MDFKALVTAQLETNNVESELKNLCKDRDINLKVKIDDNEIKKIQDKIETINVDLGKILNVGNLNSVSQKIGEQIGNATRKGMSNAFSSKEIFKMSDLKKNGIAYMSKVSNTIEKQMGEIQKMANANGWKDF